MWLADMYIIAIRPEGAEALTGRTDCAHNNHGLRAAALSGRVGKDNFITTLLGRNRHYR